MKIIFENQHILVLEKPQNVSIQRDDTRTLSLLEIAQDFFEFKRGIESPYLGIVHRLDRHTGGVVVFAKNEKANRELNRLFAAHDLTKKYLARVEGTVNKYQEEKINYLLVDKKLNKSMISTKDNQNAKLAHLKYTKLCEYTTLSGTLTDLEVELFTGRQHQIRAQLAHMGNPILGDEKYGSIYPETQRLSMALWATELKFKLFGKKYEFTSSPPESGIWTIK